MEGDDISVAEEVQTDGEIIALSLATAVIAESETNKPLGDTHRNDPAQDLTRWGTRMPKLHCKTNNCSIRRVLFASIVNPPTAFSLRAARMDACFWNRNLRLKYTPSHLTVDSGFTTRCAPSLSSNVIDGREPGCSPQRTSMPVFRRGLKNKKPLIN